MNLPMIDQNLLAKDGYNDLNLILDLVIVNRERAKYIGLALDVLDTIQVNVENQVNDINRHQQTGKSVISRPVCTDEEFRMSDFILESKHWIFENT